MQTSDDLRPPASPLSGRPQQSRVAWLIAIASVVALAWQSASRYEPLSTVDNRGGRGRGWVWGGQALVNAYPELIQRTGDVVTETDAYPSGRVFTVPFADNADFWIAFDVRNDGPVGITFRDIENFYSKFELVQRVTDLMAPWNHGPQGGGGLSFGPKVSLPGTGQRGGSFVPLRPFALPAGKSRTIALQYRFVDCDNPGGKPPESALKSKLGIKSQEVSFRILGMSRHTNLELPFGVALTGALGPCPRMIREKQPASSPA